MIFVSTDFIKWWEEGRGMAGEGENDARIKEGRKEGREKK